MNQTPSPTVSPLDADVFGLDREHKRAWLLDGLNELTGHHRSHCPEYGRMLEALWPAAAASTIESVPWLPVRLFKHLDL
jgi:hypothetical protein